MYKSVDGVLTLSVNDWCAAGLTKSMFENDSKKGMLNITRRSIHGNTLIDVRSIRRPDRRAILEAA